MESLKQRPDLFLTIPSSPLLGLDRFCPTLPATIARMNTKLMQVRQPNDRFTVPIIKGPGAEVLPMKDTLQVKAAEFWLKMGEADRALRELERLSKTSWNQPFAVKVQASALAVLEGGQI